MFEEILVYIAKFFEYFFLSPDSNANKDVVAKVQVLLNHVTDLNSMITLVVSRKLFDYAISVKELLRAKSNDIV